MKFTVKSIADFLDGSIKENWVRSAIQEYNYLLSYISESRFDRFKASEDYLREIAENADLLIKRIDEEIGKDVLKEQSHFGISKETAIRNMQNLQDIIISIKKYFF